MIFMYLCTFGYDLVKCCSVKKIDPFCLVHIDSIMQSNKLVYGCKEISTARLRVKHE